MKHLVIGLGEVGASLREALSLCDGYDPEKHPVQSQEAYDVIHICFGYSSGFEDWVRAYRLKYKPKYVVIHSTVPIGTSDRLEATHSPIRGRHPNLKESIRTFAKYVGGKDAHEIAKEFLNYGMQTIAVPSAKTTEALKLFDLMQFGASVLVEKEIHAYCEKHGLDFDTIYRHANETYNRGYQALGHREFTRPVLKHIPGPIGGHCVVPMMELLDSETARSILAKNKEFHD